MKARFTWMMGIAALLAGHPAAAQTSEPAGSLTVLSRPSGVAFRVSGEQVVVGRTPMVIDRGLSGRYEVSSLDGAFSTWKRTLFLSGTAADTVWMTLHARGRSGAALRSLMIPGWGQAYGHHRGRGALMLGATAAAGAALAVTAVRYHDRLGRYRDADARYQSAGTVSELDAAFEARRLASSAAEDAYQTRQIVFGAFCGVWGLNLLDALITFPSLPSDRLSLSITPPHAASSDAPMATLTVRF